MKKMLQEDLKNLNKERDYTFMDGSFGIVKM